MFDIGLPELLIILGVALIVLGPQRLPELARTLGKALAELRRTSDDLRRNVLMGEGLDDDTHHPTKTPAAGTISLQTTHTKEVGDPKDAPLEKDLKQDGTSETPPSPSTRRGLDG